MSTAKRIDMPCPWCGTRCCKLETLTGYSCCEWVCGSKDTPGGERWQSPTCRHNELELGAAGERCEKLEAEIERLRAIKKAKDALLAIYNDEDVCNVEFDTQVTLEKFTAAQDDLAAAEAVKEKP